MILTYESSLFTQCILLSGVVKHLPNHIPFRLARARWIFGHFECNMSLTFENSRLSQNIRLFCITMNGLSI